MFAATTSPWYFPTWVSCQMPVTSPTAHRRSPARRCASTGTPRGVHFDADRLQAEPLDARPAAGGDEQAVAAQLVPVVQHEHVLVAVASRFGRVRAEGELDAVAAQDLAERLAQRRGLAGQHVVGGFDDRHLAAEAADGLRHLDADRPPAEHEQPARYRLHAGHLTVRPDALELAQPGNRRHERVGSVGEDDVIGGVADAVDLDDPGPGEPPAAAQQRRCRCPRASAPGPRRSSSRP